ncbi:MAG TPA: glycosyltransferase 87 family protein [Acidobacteriaceae bacterium]|jgi:hypothetical protein|nr:glycosyltransferase 87 family protein [Acidobacteriaceae bacterium]
MRNSSGTRAATLALLSVNIFPACLIGVMLILELITGSHVNDFLSYWAAAKQIVHHANPYDADAVLRLQLSAGLPAGTPAVLMRNPPVIFPLVYPLGLLGAAAGSRVWIVLLTASFAVSVVLLGRVYRMDHRKWLALAFEPGLHCVHAEQLGLVLALSLSLFLYLKDRHQFLAGLSLSLLAFKPHLFIPGALVVIAWSIWERRIRFIAGLFTGAACLWAAAWLIDPAGWHQYRALISDVAGASEWIPCISILLRSHVPHRPIWAQYLPSALAAVAALGLYLRARDSWEWRDRAPFLVALGIATAPYTWFTDQAALVPVAVYALSRPLRSGMTFAALNAVLMLVLFTSINLHSVWLAWSSVAFLAWAVMDGWPLGHEAPGQLLKPVLSTD